MSDEDFDLDLSVGDMPTMGEMNQEVLAYIDQYELQGKLGRGAFGAVFLAKYTVADTLVALKTLPPELSHSPEDLQGVKDNFRLVSRLAHPHIASLKHLHHVQNVHSMGPGIHISSGEYLVVMEYVEGSTLRNWVRQFADKRVPLDKAIKVCMQIAAALDYAHSQKIIHRDIKPGNIMVNSEAEVKVLDFGLAAEVRSSMSRLSTDKGSTSGTRPYMPPEQLLGRKQNESADQYALAVLLYELISGCVPFQSLFETNDMQLILGVVPTRPVDPLDELNKKQNGVLLQALAKNPNDRFSSCTEFIQCIENPKLNKSKKNLKPLVAVMSLVVVGGGAGFYIMNREPVVKKDIGNLLENTQNKSQDDLQEAQKLAQEVKSLSEKLVSGGAPQKFPEDWIAVSKKIDLAESKIKINDITLTLKRRLMS